jgi:hypothetical protein
MSPLPPLVHIRYLRPPDRREVFSQRLVLDTPEVKITLAQNVPFDPPIRIHGEVALEAGSDAVWFTFPGRWHDIGLFHRADGAPTGTYANIITPPEFLTVECWQTTDLFLDLWLDRRGTMSVLDEEEFESAVRSGWLTGEQETRARQELVTLRRAHEEGRWPPPIVAEWTLERARLEARDRGA